MFFRSSCNGARFLTCGLRAQKWDLKGHEKFQRVHMCLFSTRISAVPLSTSEETVLVRDFIHSALYDEKKGYFAVRSHAVGELPAPLNFNLLEGKRAYTQHLERIYKQSDISWFTPVELFQPHYGHAIAQFILRTHIPTSPLRIYEIGGGTGTCARNVLDFMKTHAPRTLYDTMTYTSVEISGALAKKQYEKVVERHSRHNQFGVECRNASDRIGWGPVDKETCFVIMLEVLDNLPHDLVYRETPKSPWMETHVTERRDGGKILTPFEVLRPLQDNLIHRCLDAIEVESARDNSIFGSLKNSLVKFMNESELVWVPTGCLQLLETLHSVRPNMILIASDFSSLPDVKIAGERAPLVSSKTGGHNKDHSTYLDAKGQADIFFPTDFKILQRLDHSCSAAYGSSESRKSSIVRSAQFLDLFADTEKTITRDGYNPLLEDFSNTKFYLSTTAGQFQSS